MFGPKVATSDNIRYIVVLLHGYGSNGDNLFQALAPTWKKSLNNTLIIAPNAPFQHPHFEDGYQWFGFTDVYKINPDEIISGIKSARPILLRYKDDLKTHYKIKDENIIFAGFSQGAMLALDLLVQDDMRYAVAYSGSYYPINECIQSVQKKTLLVHGKYDEIVPYGYMKHSKEALEKQGIEVQTLTCHTEHNIDLDGIIAGENFLKEIINE